MAQINPRVQLKNEVDRKPFKIPSSSCFLKPALKRGRFYVLQTTNPIKQIATLEMRGMPVIRVE